MFQNAIDENLLYAGVQQCIMCVKYTIKRI
jgi:hypothetical protein